MSPDERAPVGSVIIDIVDQEASKVLYHNISYAQWSDWHEHGGEVTDTWHIPDDISSGWYHIIYQGVTGSHCSTNGQPIYRVCPGVVSSSTMIFVE